MSITILAATYNGKILHLEFDTSKSSLSLSKSTDVSSPPFSNPSPSWIEPHCCKPNYFYVSNETAEGKVVLVEVVDGGKDLKYIGSRDSGGADPAHVGASSDGKWLMAANYSGASILAIRLDSAGTEFAASSSQQVIKFPGSGPDKGRQEASHPHMALEHPVTKTFFVPDLGTDEIHEIGLVGGVWQPIGKTIVTPGGSGPRHIRFTKDGKTAYLVNEMANEVQIYNVELGTPCTLSLITSASILFEGATPVEGLPLAGAAIILSKDEKHLYISNRDDANILGDSIVHFPLPTQVTLGKPTYAHTKGIHIRGMEFDKTEIYLIAGCMLSNLVVVFERDPSSGELKEVARLEVEKGTKVTGFLWLDK